MLNYLIDTILNLKQDAIKSLQHEAASVINIGFLLFYPTQSSCVALLRNIVNNKNPNLVLLSALVDKLTTDEIMIGILSKTFQLTCSWVLMK